MKHLSLFAVLISNIAFSTCLSITCRVECPNDNRMVCGFNEKSTTFEMFPNECTMKANAKCYGVYYRPVKLYFCIADHAKSRRYDDDSSSEYGTSCPVFCPGHYRPVCGASRIRDYVYRSFLNKCQLDMLSCRGNDDSGYVQVPLDYCERHAMKNIYKEQIIVSGIHHGFDYKK